MFDQVYSCNKNLSFQTLLNTELENLVVNTALLQLVGVAAPAQPYHPPIIRSLPADERLCYDLSIQGIEELARYLKFNGNGKHLHTVLLYYM